ncbi:MAG TPA: hypothetical protein VK738_11070 [Terriglobales bacterium]|jgi:hypothetical protein|nr:hypothetical protein [Terriglobales bacterium]
MDCREFQKILPDVIDEIEESQAKEHLHSCAACSQLVADLTFISRSARLLLPLMDPSPRVWTVIKKSLPLVSGKMNS